MRILVLIVAVLVATAAIGAASLSSRPGPDNGAKDLASSNYCVSEPDEDGFMHAVSCRPDCEWTDGKGTIVGMSCEMKPIEKGKKP